MINIKNLTFIIFIFLAQNANANWILFYESQMFDARLLLTSVQQDKQITEALIALDFKDSLIFNGVTSHVIFLEHICGETNPKIIEEKFYDGPVKKDNEILVDSSSVKFKKYAKKTFPNLVKQICI
jgi:hypothetical protein